MNKKEIVEWIVKNVDDRDVPSDEGNGKALVYNLVHLALDGRDSSIYIENPPKFKLPF
jgi:hypothetical protein